MQSAVPLITGALGIGGVGVVISGRRELIQRWLTWAVSAPIVGGLLWVGPPGAALLAAGLGSVAAAEYARLVRLPDVDRLVVVVVVTAGPLFMVVEPDYTTRLAVIAVVLAMLPPLLAGDCRGGAARVAYAILGLAWLAPLAGLVILGGDALALCLAVAVADVAAWCAGRAIGGPRLSALSPNKTVAGVVGGGLAGVAVLVLLHAASPALLIAVTIGAPLGDLFESMIKRAAGVKDAGTWLPGFGGLLDRIDSLLVALALAVAFS